MNIISNNNNSFDMGTYVLKQFLHIIYIHGFEYDY